MCGRQVVVTNAHFRANELGLRVREAAKGNGVGGNGELGEMLLGVLDELLVVNTTSTNKDHAVRRVVGLDVRREVIALDGEDVSLGAEDGATQGLTCKTKCKRPCIVVELPLAVNASGIMRNQKGDRPAEVGAEGWTNEVSTSHTLVRNCMQMIENDLLHLLINLLLLAQDHIALPLYSRRLQSRVLQNVADDVNTRADVLGEALRVIHRLLARRVRVEVRTNTLNGELELVLRATVGALECHVLEEVCRAIRRVRLRPRPRIDPHAHRRRLRMWVRLGCYREPI